MVMAAELWGKDFVEKTNEISPLAHGKWPCLTNDSPESIPKIVRPASLLLNQWHRPFDLVCQPCLGVQSPSVWHDMKKLMIAGKSKSINCSS